MHESFRSGAKAYLGESNWTLLQYLGFILFAAAVFCIVGIFVMESLVAALLSMGCMGLLLLGLSCTVARVNQHSHRDTGMTWGIYRGFMYRPPEPPGWVNTGTVFASFVVGLGMLCVCVWGLVVSSS